ncbi:hypothetical protein CRH09_32775 [Nocardia terpenica]|uniref:Uncharacterized protein n=2 Tax=Nocardia terpenica TaxID=455432 RepID=A0A291RRL0_9NOCA|nr:hypothetical protein CRH09_32775 [Nocardia terpenica]
MMGQGARGKSDDDKEHKSPDLLRGQHLEEWIHNGQKVMPAFGAIGEEESPGQSRNQPPGSPSDAPGHNRLSGEYR